FVQAAVFESQTRARHDVEDCLRDEKLPTGGLRHHARGYVHRDAAEGSVAFLHLAEVDAAANADTQLLRLLLEAAACPNGANWALESGKEAIARLIDEPTSEGGNSEVCEPAVLGQQVRPALVLQPAREWCRALDVALQDRTQLARFGHCRADAGHE